MSVSENFVAFSYDSIEEWPRAASQNCTEAIYAFPIDVAVDKR
jgi:hypothetical protein